MTQPLCAYEGCGRNEFYWKHTVKTSDEYHPFQHRSTVESAPDDQPKEGDIATPEDDFGFENEPAAQSGESTPVKCGLTVAAISPRMGMYIPCALDIGHKGDCVGAGNCVKHGPYLGKPHAIPQCPKWPDCIPEAVAMQLYSMIPAASTSPQGAGEQWKPDCDIEAMRNALSKLESQVCRNPDLPEAYKTILRDGFKAVGNIELRLKAGAQGAGYVANSGKLAGVSDRVRLAPGQQLVNEASEGEIPTGAQGAVPGPQDSAAPKSAQFLLRSWMETHASDCGCKLCGDTRKRLATPEHHSPHVHNFDANGICVTMGCTPAIPAAASTDERLAEMKCQIRLINDEEFLVYPATQVPLAQFRRGAVHAYEELERYAADLLRLVAELCGDLKTVNEAWHADLVQWGQEHKAAKARAEQA